MLTSRPSTAALSSTSHCRKTLKIGALIALLGTGSGLAQYSDTNTENIYIPVNPTTTVTPVNNTNTTQTTTPVNNSTDSNTVQTTTPVNNTNTTQTTTPVNNSTDSNTVQTTTPVTNTNTDSNTVQTTTPVTNTNTDSNTVQTTTPVTNTNTDSNTVQTTTPVTNTNTDSNTVQTTTPVTNTNTDSNTVQTTTPVTNTNTNSNTVQTTTPVTNTNTDSNTVQTTTPVTNTNTNSNTVQTTTPVQPTNNTPTPDPTPVVVLITPPVPDYKPEMAQAGLTLAQSQGQMVIATIQGALNDINGRLFNLRAGGGEIAPSGGIASSLDDGVIVGQGDGPESPVARRIDRAYQWQVYSTVNFAYINQSQINTQAGVRSTSWTPGLGIERHLNPNLALGFAASLIETHQTYANNLGTLDIQGVAVSTYLSYVRSAFWSDVLYSFGALSLDSARNPGFGLPQANGDTTAYTNTVQLNGGWNFRFQNGSLVTGPFIGVDYMHASVDGYTESGGGIGALAYGRRSYDSLISRIGWAVSKTLDTGSVKITPQLRVAFERQNISNNNGTSVNLINQSFTATATSQAPGQEYLMAGAGVNFQFSDRLNLLLTYQGQFFRQDQTAHYAGLRLSLKF